MSEERERTQLTGEILYTSQVFQEGDKEANLAAAEQWGRMAENGNVKPFTPFLTGRDVIIKGGCHRPTNLDNDLVSLDDLPEDADREFGVAIEEDAMATTYQGVRHVSGDSSQPLGFFAVMTGRLLFANKIAEPTAAEEASPAIPQPERPAEPSGVLGPKLE